MFSDNQFLGIQFLVVLDVSLETEYIDIQVISGPVLLGPVQRKQGCSDALRHLTLPIVKVGESQGNQGLQGSFVFITIEVLAGLINLLGDLQLAGGVPSLQIRHIQFTHQYDILGIHRPMDIEMGDALLLKISNLLMDLGKVDRIIKLAGQY
ncbi:hypothetical protein DSECCO2_634420 [anaerobic digester metagenome]